MKEATTQVSTRHQVIGQTLVINLGGRRRVLSSAPQGGGFRSASHIINHQVDANPGMNGHFPDPARCLRKLASQLKVGSCTVGLMTAVPMTQLVTSRVSADELWVECFATVGVTNAVRAGEWPQYLVHRKDRRSARMGTINLILITNGSLSTSAMVGVVQVATETKTGVLRDHAIPSWKGRDLATGTGTDAVVIACCLRGEGPLHTYSGTHTIFGALVGRAVSACVSRGLAMAKKWQKLHQ
ncbi:MAG: adenosylcobinamide amidohydrolase [Nitrospira sp.]|nr:adenosylcobinamide amidohydrolase [Nitrospira sp.]